VITGVPKKPPPAASTPRRCVWNDPLLDPPVVHPGFNPSKVRLEPDFFAGSELHVGASTPRRCVWNPEYFEDEMPLRQASTPRRCVWNVPVWWLYRPVLEASTPRRCVWNDGASISKGRMSLLQPLEGASGTTGIESDRSVFGSLQPLEGASGTALARPRRDRCFCASTPRRCVWNGGRFAGHRTAVGTLRLSLSVDPQYRAHPGGSMERVK